MLLSNLPQLNLDALKDKLPQGLPQGLPAPEGDGMAFLDALLQSQGISLSEQDLAKLAAALREQAGKDLPEDGSALPGFLAELPVLDQPVTGPVEALSELPEQSEVTEAAQHDPEQLLAMMLAAAGEGERQVEAGKKQELALMAGRGRATALFAQLRNGLGSDFQPQASVDAVQVHNADAFRPNLLQSEAAQAAVQLRLDHPVQQPGFGQAVGERLVWMVQNQLQHARIRLDPPHLGPLEISVSVKDDQASVAIVAQHAVTREALQADMPRLREMLGENGFAAVDVNVAQDDGRGERADAEERQGGGGIGSAAEGAETEAEAPAVRQGLGLVDHYA